MWRISVVLLVWEKYLKSINANVQTPSCEPLENAFQKTRDKNRCPVRVTYSLRSLCNIAQSQYNQKGCLLAELEGISLLNITRLFSWQVICQRITQDWDQCTVF